MRRKKDLHIDGSTKMSSIAHCKNEGQWKTKKRLFQGSVQNLAVIPGLFAVQHLAAHGFQRGAVQVRETQFVGAQGLILQLQLPVGRIVAVLAVAQNGAADASQMGADLVGTPGASRPLMARVL